MTDRGDAPEVTALVASLPATVPFVGPEAIERRSGIPLTVRLGANESSFGPSPAAREAMRRAVDRAQNYGDPENHNLRAALAQRYGVGMEHIAVGSGIDDLLGLIVRAYLTPRQTAVTSLGAYATFSYHVAGYGGVLERVPYRVDGYNDLDGLAEAAQRTQARIVYLANPDNPSGTWYRADELETFAARLPAKCLFLLDEAYCDFAPADALLPVDVEDRHVVRARTFSKAHGMAGARIGYVLASAETVAAFERIGLHFGVNLIAQAGALASLGEPDYVRGVVAEVARGREEYAALAADLGLSTFPSATNFVTIETGSQARARTLVEQFAARGVFIRMPGAPPLNSCIRITVGTAPERAIVAQTLRELWPQVAGERAGG